MNCLYFQLLVITLTILEIASANLMNYETFMKNNQFGDISSYAKLNGFSDFDIMFTDFKTKFNRNYTVEEEEIRKYFFLNSLIEIEKNKKQLRNGEVNHELGINKFSDFSPDEYSSMLNNWSRNKLLSFTEQYNKDLIESSIDTTKPLPQSFDWRERNVVTKVKDQGVCGSCWAFAGIATIESAYAIRNNLTKEDLIEFSEQQMVDCVSGGSYISHGCGGGTPIDVYSYAINYGVVQEESYPYLNSDNIKKMPCRKMEDTRKTKIKDYFLLKLNSEDNIIMHTVYSKGPVAVIINAGDEDFKNYHKGILTSIGDQTIDNSQTNHFITCVGWGTENGIDFWIMKNSYGKTWGEDGYFRIKRGINSRGFNKIILYPSFSSNSLMTSYSLIFNISLFALVTYIKLFSINL